MAWGWGSRLALGRARNWRGRGYAGDSISEFSFSVLRGTTISDSVDHQWGDRTSGARRDGDARCSAFHAAAPVAWAGSAGDLLAKLLHSEKIP